MTTNEPSVAYLGLDHHHCVPYLQSLEQLPCAVTCAYEPNESIDGTDVTALPDVPVYRSLEPLLDDQHPDIVWVTRSNRETPDILERVVERGIDVYVEKPAARTAAALEPLVDAAANARVTVTPSYTWRAHPIATHLRECAAGEFYGTVESFSLRFFASAVRHRNPDHYVYDKTASRGGIVQWLGVHWIDLLPWILDDPIVSVDAKFRMSKAVDVETTAVVTLETASGAIGSLECGYTLRDGRYDTQIDIRGSRGRSEWDPMGRTFGFDDETEVTLDSSADGWASTPRRTITHDYQPAPGYGGRWGLAFMQRFLDAREGDGTGGATLDDAVQVLRILDAIYQSASENRPVTVGDATDIASQ